MAANLLTLYDCRKSRQFNSPLLEIQKLAKKSIVLCSGFLAAILIRGRLPLTGFKVNERRYSNKI